jgi:uncharacterized protein YbaP (TraB family)
MLAMAGVLLCGCTPAAPSVVAHPPMWEVSDGDTRLILIGSVHRLPPNLIWSGGRVADALATADEAWLELSPEEMAGAATLFERMSRDEPVPPLAQRLPANDSAIIRRLATTGGMSSTNIDMTESWAVAIAAGRGALAGSDVANSNGVEAVVTEAMRGRPIIGLESAADQLDAFDRLDPAVQDRMLAAGARRAPSADADVQRLVTAWARGDEAALSRIAADGLADTPELVEPLVHARNRRWATLLLRRMQRPGTILVAVGTGHLVGDQSLIQMLRQHGLSVRRLTS